MSLPGKIAPRSTGGVNSNTNYVIVPTLLGTIDFNDVNAEAAAASITLILANAKAAGKYAKIVFIKTITPFASVTRDIDTAEIQSNYNTQPLNAAGSYVTQLDSLSYEQPAVDDITVTLTFAGGGVNPQDYTAGEAEIYAEFITIPTL